MVFCLRPIGKKYIELCKRESQKTLFAYGLSLTDQQKAAIQARLEEIEDPLIPLGTKFTVDEKKRGRGKAYLLLPTETGSRCDPL